MANCGFKIIKSGTNYIVGVNQDQTSFSSTDYNLNVNGTANISSNMSIGGSLTLSTPLAIAQGGTGATTSAAALTNIGAASAGHNHAITDLTGTLTIAKGGTGKTTATEAWTALGGGASGKHADSYFALASHNHAAGDITSGTLGLARGGTGVTANPSMLVNLGSTTAANVFAASPRPGITGTLPTANGGTGATTAANARTNLGLGTAATHAHGDYVAVTGDQSIAGTKTFTGYVDIKTTYPYLRWANASTGVVKGFIQFSGMAASSVSAAPQFFIYQYAITSTGTQVGSYERYGLPAPASTITTHGYYSILTSKSAVTIAQGGTGKTTATEAWTALGGGASGKHADSYFALSGHTHNAATTAAAGFVSTGAQTWAGTKTFNGDIEIKSGFYINGSTAFWWKKTNLTTGSNAVAICAAGMATNSSAPYLYVTEYAYTTAGARSTYYENYRFPSPAATITANGTYDIWTTKNYYATSSTALTYVTNSHCDSTNLGYLRVDRSGRIAVLTTTTALYLKAYSSSAWIQVGTVPAGYRPVAQVTVRVPLSSGNYMVRVTTAGALQIYKSTNETSNAYFSIPWRIA